jgi:hypothetical protein
LLVLLISTYKIGSLLDNKKSGALAAVLLSFSPLIFAYSRVGIAEFPLTATIALSVLCLLKSNHFTSLSWTILTGISFALSQLIKETAILFIFPFFIYYTVESFRLAKIKRECIYSFLIILSIFFLIAGRIYLFSCKDLFIKYWSKSFICKGSFLSPEWSWFYYLKMFPYFYIGLFLTAMIIPLALFHLLKFKKINIFLIVWFILPLLIFSFASNQGLRFLIPIMPAFFLVVSQMVFALQGFLRRKYIIILISLSLLQYLFFNTLPTSIPNTWRWPKIYKEKVLWFLCHETGLFFPFKEKDFKLVEQILNVFKNERFGRSNKYYRVLFTFTAGIDSPLDYEFKFNQLPFIRDCPQVENSVDSPAKGTVNWQNYLITADYVVHSTSNSEEIKPQFDDISGAFKESLKRNKSFFKEIAVFDTEGGDKVFIYKNIKKAPSLELDKKIIKKSSLK